MRHHPEKDMRDDHAQRRHPRSTAASRPPAADPGAGPVDGPDPRSGPARRVDRGLRWLLVATGACIVGCAVLIAVGGSTLVTFLGISLGGVAFVLVLSAVFYVIGRSEDRERAEREAGGARPTP